MKGNIIHIIGVIIVIGILAALGFRVHLESGVEKIPAAIIILLSLTIAIALSYLIYYIFDRKHTK